MTPSREMEEIDVVARRVELLEYLTDVTARKSELVTALETSRSTIDRAIKRLEAAGFVERRHAGYTTTQTGRLAAARYRQFVREQRSILEAREVLNVVSRDAELPIDLLLSARVETDDSADGLFGFLADRLASAESCRAMLPALPDSRQLRLCHAETVRGALDVELLVEPAVRSRLGTEFPRLSAELVEHGDVDVFRSDGLSYGLFMIDSRTEEGDRQTTVVFVAYQDGDVRGYVVTDESAAVQWATTYYEQCRGTAVEASNQLRDADTAGSFARLTGDRLPAKLRTEGFVRVDEAFLDRRDPVEPTTAWRAGIGLPEVAAGYAVARSASDGQSTADPTEEGSLSASDEPTTAASASAGRSSGGPMADDRSACLADELLSSLSTGTDNALVGPPGSGKSTIAKRVAYAWYEREYGQVFYRESGMGQPIDSAALLEGVLDRAPEPVLVVVEDAVDPDTNAIFEVMLRLSGRDDVVFLLDARERDWTDPDDFPTDARLRAYRQQSVETTTLPRIDRDGCRRLLEQAEAVVDESIEISVDTLLADVEDVGADQDGIPPGSTMLLFDRLSRTIEPLSAVDDTRSPSVLDEDIDRLRADLADVGELALDVGVLVTVLNAAGVGVYPAYVHALAVEATDADATIGTARSEQLATVRAALDRLDGYVLFETDDDRPPYRTIHGTWSVRFLERLLEAAPRVTRRRFGRCLTTLLALADRPDWRAELRELPNVDETALAAIEFDPSDWADDTAASVLDLGEQHAQLAPLFGTADAPTIALPDACSSELRLQQCQRIGQFRLNAGDTELAREAFERLDTAASALDTSESTRYRVESLLGRSRLARLRGAYDDARAVLETAIDLAIRHGDRRLEARCRFQLGVLARNTEQFDEAIDRFERCRETFRDLEDSKREADALRRLGEVRAMGAELTYGRPETLGTAIDELEASLTRYRSLGDRRGEADARRWLGQVTAVHPERSSSSVRQQHRAVVELARQLGDPDREARSLYALGDSWAETEEFDRARTHFERALELFQESDRTAWTVVVRRRLGILDVLDGAYDRARKQLETALEEVRSIDRPTMESRVLRALAALHVYCHELEAATRYARASLELGEELSDGSRVVRACQSLGRAQLLAGDLDAASDTATRLRAAVRAYDVDDATPYLLAPLALLHGDHATACEHARRGLDGPEPEGLYAVVLGRIALANCALDDALARFTDAIEEQYYDEHRYWSQHALIDRARVHRRRGDLDAATADLETALGRARDRQYHLQEARAILQRGALARARGDLDRAVDYLDRALDRCRDLGIPLYEARACFELGLVALDRNDPTTAREHLTSAAEQFRQIGARYEEARVLGTLLDTCPWITDANDTPGTNTELEEVTVETKATSVAVGETDGSTEHDATAAVAGYRERYERLADELSAVESRTETERSASAGI